MPSISHPTESRTPDAACPLCGDPHDEVLALLAHDADGQLRRIPSADLESEWEYVKREMASVKADADYSVGLATLYRHRLSAIDAEVDRRRRLERHGGPRGKGGRIPLEVVAEIKRRIDLATLVSEDLGEPKYRGGKVWFRCKLHGRDTNPSLAVYEEDPHWWCFGCGDGGDTFDWLLKARNMEWREAAEYLSSRCGVTIPKPKKATAPAIVGGSIE